MIHLTTGTESHLWEEVVSEIDSCQEERHSLIKGVRKKIPSGTCQLCNNCLEGELSEVLDQGHEHTPVDYFSFAIVQFIDTHRITVMNLLHLHPVPPR